MNKFENTGDFLKRYMEKNVAEGDAALGKREQPSDSDSEDEETTLDQKTAGIRIGDQAAGALKVQQGPTLSSEIEKAGAGPSPSKVQVVDDVPKQT